MIALLQEQKHCDHELVQQLRDTGTVLGRKAADALDAAHAYGEEVSRQLAATRALAINLLERADKAELMLNAVENTELQAERDREGL